MFGTGMLMLKNARPSAPAACIVWSVASLLIIFTAPFGRMNATCGTKRHFSFVKDASAGCWALTLGTVTTTLLR